MERFTDYKGDYQGLTFKPSTLKVDGTLRFIPTNLHVQEMVVQSSETACEDAHGKLASKYGVVTFGAPAAHVLRFRHGVGLLQLSARYENLYELWHRAFCGSCTEVHINNRKPEIWYGGRPVRVREREAERHRERESVCVSE
jgi:hypothetical protein